MKLSHDYIGVRVALLPDEVIHRLADQYFNAFEQLGIPLSPSKIRTLNQQIHEEMPGKEDLVTEWILDSVSQHEGKYPGDMPAFIEAAKFFFAHNKEVRFKQAVNAVSKASMRDLNPKNLLDFPLHRLAWVERKYGELTDDPKVNELSMAMPMGSELFYNGHGYQIYKVTNLQAACQLSQGTSWCTKWTPDTRRYLGKGPLYLIYRKTYSYALLHIVENDMSEVQLNDHDNDPIRVLEENLRQALIDSGLMDKILSGNGYLDEGDFTRFAGTESNPYLAEICAKNAELAYFYALKILHKRFPEGETVLIAHPQEAIWYARDVIKGRFIEAEPAIIKSRHIGHYTTILRNSGHLDEFIADMEKQKETGWVPNR
jgi:hypothetical protein